MAENKKSFLFYVDWGATFDELSDEYAGKLIKHLCDYVADKNPETDDILINAVFANMKNALKRDLDKWKSKSAKNKESAHKRWDKNNANASERIQVDAKHADRDRVSDSDSVNDSVSGNDNDILIYPEGVYACYDICIKKFPENLVPKDNKTKKSWLDTIDKLKRIDDIPFDLIEKITEGARNSNFWSKNFLSLTKLRKKNDDGVSYIVVFNEYLKSKHGKQKGFGFTNEEIAEAVRRQSSNN